MKKIEFEQNGCLGITDDANQKGSAIVISLFVLALISVFVALALSRSSAEAAAVGNETAEGRTFYAAQGSLETMTRNFNKVFEVKLNPTTAELDAVRNGAVAGLGAYTFKQELDNTTPPGTPDVVVLSGGPFTGLYAIRDNWRLRSTATNNVGVQVQLSRNVLNNRVPIFQFGIFYDDDLELFRPPRFSFGGRVHSNRNFFLSPGSAGVYFDSRVTAVGQIITQTWRNGNTGDMANSQTFIKNASGVDKQLLPTQGSVLNTTSGAADNIFASDPDMPPSKLNTNFTTQSAIFDGNLQNNVKPLKLPIKIDSANTDLIEMIKRGKKIADVNGGDLYDNAADTLAPVIATSADSDILKEERFANKPGIRISLADSKAKLPGCASGVGTAAIAGPCGVRLDGSIDGLGGNPLLLPQVLALLPQVARGYQPVAMKKLAADATYTTYVPTRVNGDRLYTDVLPMPATHIREVWIKVETVDSNAGTGAIITKDITIEFLSLGVTEVAPPTITITTPGYAGTPAVNGTAWVPSANITAAAAQVPSTFPDSRSIINLQRFAMIGPQIPSTNNVLFSYGVSPNITHVVRRYSATDDIKVAAGCMPIALCTVRNDGEYDVVPANSLENYGHLKRATVNAVANEAIVPFPIEMYDSREGEYFDNPANYTAGQVTRNGVMSMIDIDAANLRRFLRGDFDGLFAPTATFAAGLRSTDIPQKSGWVVYVSDRRGDADFDGEYDMEDVFGNSPGNDGIMQLGEDINLNGILDAKYINAGNNTCLAGATTCEAPKYSDTWVPDLAAVNDHKYYRRGVRMINATTIPGNYDAVTSTNTRGFSVATENGIYVQGNFNATSVTSIPATGNTPFGNYRPFNTNVHIPASITADAVTILSNAWNDAESFAFPYDQTRREAGPAGTDTTIRFGMVSGDTISNKSVSPNQGGISPRENGGVHNFKRYLEQWTDPTDSTWFRNLNYSGSLINLFNSRNNNGSFKCCDTVYNPPVRNWVFDSTFLDPDRLPPGTPYFQYIQTTGFQRTND